MDAKDRLKQIMQQKNITEYRLAKDSGLSQSTISNIFVRNSTPSIPTLEAICNGLGISLSQFFQEEGNETPVLLSLEQKEQFEKWIALNSEQKAVIVALIHSYLN